MYVTNVYLRMGSLQHQVACISTPLVPLDGWAHASLLSLDQNPYYTIDSIFQSFKPSVIYFGQSMDVNDPKPDLKDQGHGSKVKITQSENLN